FYIYEDEWVNWECVMAFFDPGKTVFLADDYMEIRMQTRVNYGSSDVIAKLSAGPFMVMLFPLHSGENLTRGIVEGMGSGAMARRLADNGLVKNVPSFLLYVRSEKAEGDLRPGTYVFSGEVSYAQILSELKKGRNDNNTVN
ncbi:MAG: hypothetical protein OSJ64_08005, partial [Firmicutes bacterium]|nr:hypothetical protein [Bacillota bacterium]